LHGGRFVAAADAFFLWGFIYGTLIGYLRRGGEAEESYERG
jgi:uncharacterized protein (UPF0548 family)